VTGGNPILLFGDFQQFLIVDKVGLSIEIDPPRGGNPTAMLELARALKESGHVDVVDVNDNPRARARMSGLMASAAIERVVGLETPDAAWLPLAGAESGEIVMGVIRLSPAAGAQPLELSPVFRHVCAIHGHRDTLLVKASLRRGAAN